MKSYQGAIFCDIDGTLVDERHEIFRPTEKVRAGLTQMQEKGFLIGVATGRARCYIPDLGIDFNCYISCNGAVAEVDGKEVFSETIATEELKEIIACLEEIGMGYIVENANECFYDKRSEKEIMKFLDVFHMDKRCFFPLESLNHMVVNKMVLTFDMPEKYYHFKEKFSDRYLIPMHRNGFSADLGKSFINKASGIQAVVQAFDLNQEQIYAFGDYDNDVEMLQTVAHGIAMTPHSEAVARVAEYVTCGVENDGIYWGLKHFHLID